MQTLKPESIDCIVTSPPYYGLRDYGTEPLVWGGKKDCEHEWFEDTYYYGGGATGVNGERFSTGGEDNAESVRNSRNRIDTKCIHCGAWKGQLGRERHLVSYLNHMSMVFREIYRVLKPDGTVWLNIGDSYKTCRKRESVSTLIPYKGLMQVGYKLVNSLVEQGWILRNEIIWSKTNPSPDPANDRLPKTHEQIYLLTKRPNYYFNTELNKEKRWGTVWRIAVGRSKEHSAVMPLELAKRCVLLGCPEGGITLDPFCGSGTVLKASKVRSGFGVGIDVDPDSIKLSARNIFSAEESRKFESDFLKKYRHNQLNLVEEGYGIIE